jgi:hypothetical protein
VSEPDSFPQAPVLELTGLGVVPGDSGTSALDSLKTILDVRTDPAEEVFGRVVADRVGADH